MEFRISTAFLTSVAALLLIGCGGDTPRTGCGACPHESSWTWVNGSNTVRQAGVYGSQGTASPSNLPGARQFPVSWTDKSGNLWLFGGNGVDAIVGYLNDLWKFDGTNWTWVTGSTNGNAAGVYGVQGVPSPTNTPGGRNGGPTWVDGGGNLWLFGGWGADSVGTTGFLNDVWKFDGVDWTWVSGSNLANQSAAYGTKGTPAASNTPGGRVSSITWRDRDENLWLFGGDGPGFRVNMFRNDLWKFDGTNWTWVSGSSLGGQAGVYGTKGTADSGNVPGGRDSAVSWIDSSGNLWLFGGNGLDSAGTADLLNDLWKFDGTNWTWVSGSNLTDQAGAYGTKGAAGSSNMPGARFAAVTWRDSTGNFWLFGGAGIDSTGKQRGLNDFWKFDGANWTWIGGSDVGDQAGVYGTLGTGSASNAPGARLGFVSWTDTSGNLWLFGGAGDDSTGTFGFLNDLWEFKP